MPEIETMMTMKRTLQAIAAVALLLGCGGCGIKVTKPMLQMIVSGTNKVSTAPDLPDSREVNGRMIAFMNQHL